MIPLNEESVGFPSPKMEEEHVSKPLAVIVCAAMALLFICAVISSIVSMFVCALILPIRSWEASSLVGVFGIRVDHMWRAVVFPLSLTSLLYAGSLFTNSLSLAISWKEHNDCIQDSSLNLIAYATQRFLDRLMSVGSNILSWRNFVVAPLTEELVFRACMIPLLLCGGFKTYNVIFLSPIFFSLAHLNHFFELYCQQNYSFFRASMVVGLQLGYTVIFGWYASFLFLRTGHLVAPIVSHIFCNIMGLPMLYSRTRVMTSVAFAAGMASFLWLLFPATSPDLYNEGTDQCVCWQGYCDWN